MSDASGASDYDEDKALEAAMNVSVAHYHFMSASLNRTKDATATVLDSDPRDANRSVAQSIAASLADAEAVSSIMNQFMTKSISTTLKAPNGSNKSVAFQPLASA